MGKPAKLSKPFKMRGSKGPSFMEAGYVYAPYMPLVSTDMLVGGILLSEMVEGTEFHDVVNDDIWMIVQAEKHGKVCVRNLNKPEEKDHIWDANSRVRPVPRRSEIVRGAVDE
jgi:hypothetical protein